MFKAEVIGNLGADCTRHEEGGREFYTFKVAHSEKFLKQDGTEVERTQWVSCVLNATLGKAVAQYLTKGRKVYVRGRASLNVYSSAIERCMKAGCQLSVDELELLGGASDDVPGRLVDPETGMLHDVYKAYFIQKPADSIQKMPATLSDGRDKQFAVDKNGFVSPLNPPAE